MIWDEYYALNVCDKTDSLAVIKVDTRSWYTMH